MDFGFNENAFKIWMPTLFKAEGDSYNSRKIIGIMSTDNKDRQGEIVKADGLDFEDFLKSGHLNDNHSQETSAIVGYPEEVKYYKSLSEFQDGMDGAGWTCKGYILKGTKRSDDIWELAKALSTVPGKSLGFSIEGKVVRRANKTIEKARIRNVAVTNCPVNTDCSFTTLAKSFYDEDVAVKSMMAGHGVSPATQSGGAALRVEDLDSDKKEIMKKKQEREKILKSILQYDDMVSSIDMVLEKRPDFTEEAAAYFVSRLFGR